MHHEPGKTIQEKIFEAINKGNVIMRPRWHFVLKTILVILGAVILFVVLTYLMSLVMFGLRETGIVFAPRFGLHGTFLFIRSLPWLLLILVGVFLIILEMLVRNYSFAYRRPLILSAFAILVVACVSGWVITRTPLHRVMMQRVENSHIPVIGHMYQGIRHPVFRDIHTGKIMVITPRGFNMSNPEDEVLMVVITPETRIFRKVEFRAGDRVMVIGPRAEDVIEAFGIRKISR